MHTRTIRDTILVLPGEDSDELDELDVVPRESSTVVDTVIAAGVWARATLASVNIRRSSLDNALTSTRFIDVTWERCVLRGCSLVGADFSGGTLKNVIIGSCRLDLATSDQVRAAGPVAFVGCSLSETTFNRCALNGAVFDDSKLAASRFEASDMRGADLRGNDLSRIAGVISLAGAIVREQQIPDITEAFVRDLALDVRAR